MEEKTISFSTSEIEKHRDLLDLLTDQQGGYSKTVQFIERGRYLKLVTEITSAPNMTALRIISLPRR